MINTWIYCSRITTIWNFNFCFIRSIFSCCNNLFSIIYIFRRIKNRLINLCFCSTFDTIHFYFISSFFTFTISNITRFKLNNYIWTFFSRIGCKCFFNPFISRKIFCNSSTFTSWFVNAIIINNFISIASSSTLW